MDTVSAEHFLTDQLPLKYRTAIPTTLKAAYKQAKIIADAEPVLQIESALDNRGRLISWTVDFGIKRLIETGQWPFEYRRRNFAKPTGRYLEIKLSHAVMTINQVKDPRKQPRDAVFRANKRLNNEPFFDLPEFDDEKQVQGIPHFILAHGHQDLHFAHVGIPHALHKREYIYRTTNLMLMPHELPMDVEPVEHTDYEAAMTLKDEIDKWRRDNGSE